MTADADLEFFFDPICPFAWITSRWVNEVADQGGYAVRWRFISLAVINEGKDYGAEFPPGYPALHGLGRELLRVCAAARAELGNDAVAALYTATGDRLHPGGVSSAIWRGDPVPEGFVADALAAAGLPAALAAAADDATWDAELREESETALARTGPDVGTPILTFEPGTERENSLFGPVISRIPRGAEAVQLWDAVRTLAATKGFAELKRSLRDDLDFS
ncbi:MAG: DsbA family protein [Acidimicrobiales bacterium]|jgi:2-hydroxychromene-2-carboxylate isomerase|nr:DsbA family protein [Acidimicrobiales bacterium]